uniref:Uncharacterized protein n=1 Tax=Heterosigma akashiwo TaxID=2829 RepID=A0A7S3Y2J8_HETAK
MVWETHWLYRLAVLSVWINSVVFCFKLPSENSIRTQALGAQGWGTDGSTGDQNQHYKGASASTLKAEVSNTRTVGASGSYFDSMGGAATAPAGKSAAATPASKPAAPISTPATPASNAASSSPAEMPAAVAEDMEVDAKALTLGGAILVAAGVAYEFFTGAFSSLAGQFSGNN